MTYFRGIEDPSARIEEKALKTGREVEGRHVKAPPLCIVDKNASVQFPKAMALISVMSTNILEIDPEVERMVSALMF